MLNTIPELYVEEKYFSRLYAVLELNSERRRKMRLDGEIGAENRKVKKYIKSLSFGGKAFCLLEKEK